MSDINKSTGPITPEGKAISARNSFRHGLTASAMVMLPFEKIEDFLELGNNLRREHAPTSTTEDCLVTKMIESLWLSSRAVKLQQLTVIETVFNQKKFDSFIRYQSMHDRAFSRALADFLKLRKDARQQEKEFVLQQQKAETHVLRIRTANVRNSAQESQTQARNARTAAAATPAPIENAQI